MNYLVLKFTTEGMPRMKSIERANDSAELRWLSIVGTRPQFVKLAPVCRAIEAHNESAGSRSIHHTIVNTGQHYDREVAELFFEQMKIPQPHFNLAVGSGSQADQLARMLERLEQPLVARRTNWVIIYGDTNSTLAGALLASRLGLPLAHVEAGCRSWDLAAPEEQNRIVADHLSKLLLAPSQNAMENLEREGIGQTNDPQGRRNVLVGDVMYDAVMQNLELAEKAAPEVLSRFGVKSGEFYLLTLHRAENTDNPERLRRMLAAAGQFDYPVVFPVHPRTAQVLAAAHIDLHKNVTAVAAQGYLAMLALEKNATKILTDSGGVQKEAFYLGVPCVTLRDETEWPETVKLGANHVAGTIPESILDAVNAPRRESWASSTPYGDGAAAHRIVSELISSTAQ
jgi:UDP-N-acetylglucosamine 2-epimerase